MQQHNVSNLVNYIASSNLHGVRKLAADNGFGPPRNEQDAKSFLLNYMHKGGDHAFDEVITKTHPDYPIFSEVSSFSNFDGEATTVQSPAPAKSCSCGGNTPHAQLHTPNLVLQVEILKLIIHTGVLVALVAAVVLLIRKGN